MQGVKFDVRPIISGPGLFLSNYCCMEESIITTIHLSCV